MEFQTVMQPVFKKMSEMPIQVKRQLLDEIYWDLTSSRHLGSRSIFEPFGFIDSNNGSSIQNMLSQQSPEVRALTVLHMRPEVQEIYIKDLDPDSKRALIIDSFNIADVKLTDVEALSEQLKFQLKGEAAGKGIVSIRPKALKLLENLSVLEELQFLKGIEEKLSDHGLSIKQNHPSLAFIGQWPEDKLRPLIQLVTVEEIVSFLRIFPEMKENLLPLCRPRVSAIAESELAREDKMSKEDKLKNLSSFKQRLTEIVDGGQVSLIEIFTTDGDTVTGVQSAA